MSQKIPKILVGFRNILKVLRAACATIQRVLCAAARIPPTGAASIYR